MKVIKSPKMNPRELAMFGKKIASGIRIASTSLPDGWVSPVPVKLTNQVKPGGVCHSEFIGNALKLMIP